MTKGVIDMKTFCKPTLSNHEKTDSNRKRFVSFLMIACLLLSSLTVRASAGIDLEEPQIVFQADELPNNIKSLIPTDKQSDNIYLTSSDMFLNPETTNNAELYTIRTENSATGEGSLIIHTTPVKYVDNNGNLQFIDTSMKNLGLYNRLFEGYNYTNAANSFYVKYGKTAGKGIMVNDSFSMAPISNQTPALYTIDITTLGHTSTENGNGKIVYPNVFGEGTKLEYVNSEAGVKENIILEKNIGHNEFSFVFKSSTHNLVLSDDSKLIYVVDKNNPNKVDYQFLDLYAYDSYQNNAVETVRSELPSGENFRHLNEECYYKLTNRNNDEYVITIVVPKEYLNHPEVVYPITIDPSAILTSSNSNAVDSFVAQSSPTTNYGTYSYLRFGYSGGKIYSYFRFNSLPTLPTGATVESAYLKFTFRTGQTTGADGKCCIVTNSSWTEDGINWNNQPYGSWSVTSSHNNFQYYNFPITSMIQGWYSGKYTNYGVNFTYTNETYNDYNSVVSSEGDASRTPQLTINYTTYGETAGITSGQTYYIKNVSSGKYLETDESLNADVIQNVFDGNSNQQWKVVYQGNGLYKLYNQYAGYISDKCCLDLASLNSDDIDMFRDSSGEYVLFNILPNGDGSFRLQNHWPGTNEVITVPDTSSLSAVYNSSWSGNSKQKWTFELAVTKLSNYKTFSAFDIGDSTEDEVSTFTQFLTSYGYKDVGIYNNANHYVPAQGIRDIGLYSDIIYINGHGGRYANLYVQNSSGTVKEYLCADSTVSISDLPKVGIGAQWISGSTTKSSSYWNQKTKWVILAQCNQLNYGTDGAGNHWNGLNSSQVWARTMLGDGARIHGILGYYNTAPGGSVHLDRLEHFLTYAQSAPLINAWSSAHNRIIGSSDWAALFHETNMSDTLTQFTPNTVNGSDYTIYLLGRAYDEEFSKTSNMSTTSFDVIANSTKYPVLIDSASTYEISSKYEDIKNKLQLSGDSNLEIDQIGRITYSNWSVDLGAESLNYSLTDEEAITLAEQKLAELGLLPNENYRTSVSRTKRRKLDLDSNQFVSPEIIEYSVAFYRTFDGVDLISDQEDGIIVTINKEGLSELKYLWRDMKVIKNRHTILEETADSLAESPEVPLTVDQAKAIYAKEVANFSSQDVSNPIISAAYLQVDGTVKPVWAFSTDSSYANSVFIDMYTGNVFTV